MDSSRPGAHALEPMLLTWLIPVWASVMKHTVIILGNYVAFPTAVDFVVAFAFVFSNQGIFHPR